MGEKLEQDLGQQQRRILIQKYSSLNPQKYPAISSYTQLNIQVYLALVLVN